MADPMTHEEIGKVLGLSRQRVHQIEKEAMAKLRRICGSNFTGGVGPFLEPVGVPDPDRWDQWTEGRSVACQRVAKTRKRVGGRFARG